MVPFVLSCSKKVRSLCLNSSLGELTAISPPLASRTLLVKALLTMRPTSCNATIAITPTATQKMASNVLCPPRTSEREGYFKYIEIFTVLFSLLSHQGFQLSHPRYEYHYQC